MEKSIYLNEVLNIWFWLFFIFFLYFLYKQAEKHFFKPEISVKKALEYLNKSLVRLIVFYQSHYSDSDQVALISKWLDNIDKDKVPEWQQNGLKNKVLDKFK